MVHVQNLSFGYSKKKLLYDNLTLSLGKGKIYGLLGKNGAGKSTFLKNLSGLLFPLKGKISVFGREPKKRSTSFLEKIYFIPEEVYVPSVSGEKYIRIFSPFYPKFNDAQMREYMKTLEVDPTARLKSLSFGQQKKFVIAFALACNTDLLLLDEPTNGLDIPSKVQFRRLIASIMNEDRIILISTHQTRDLENLIDSVLILDNGELLLNATMYRISQKLSFKILRSLPEDRPVIFSEPALGGFAVVMENQEQEEDQMNLEQLFNAVTQQTGTIQKIFNF
ncbi:MAG: ABC transporter ATP-binding protein [Bacteroidota bacterium]|nr:ABC transporter ATP-binding protein [Bacteroidota bacterium]